MPEDRNGKDKEEYTFIQEKIIPKKKRKWKRLLGMFGTSVALAVVFGLVARAVFCYSEDLFNRFLSSRPQGGGSGVQLDGSGLGTGTGSGIAGAGEDGSGGNGDGDGPILDGDGDGDSPILDGNGAGGGTGIGEAGGNGAGGSDGSGGSGMDGAGGSSIGGNGAGGGAGLDEGDSGGKNPNAGETGGNGAGDGADAGHGQDVGDSGERPNIADFLDIYQQIGQLATDVNRSVVQVSSVTSSMDWFQNPYEMEDVTSGLILAVDDQYVYVLVNYFRIRQANEIRVTFGQQVSATAVFRDAQQDIGLAVVTVQMADLPESVTEELMPALLGESYSVGVGDPVLALGNPNGYMYSMLLGMVTNKANYAYVPDNKLELFNTDMVLGEAGEGIIVNMEGRIVGLITRTLGDNPGLCTALSISRIKPLLEMMINQAPRVYLGVVGIDVPKSVEEKLPQKGGVYVSDVVEGSPAELYGIKRGDVILQIGENSIYTMSGLTTCLQSLSPGETAVVRVYRMVREESMEQEVAVTMGQQNLVVK